jgi:hypothetical protein
MLFRQQLARNVANAEQAYNAETQQMVQAWAAEVKEKFMAECEAASHRRELSFTMLVVQPDHLTRRRVDHHLLMAQLRASLRSWVSVSKMEPLPLSRRKLSCRLTSLATFKTFIAPR